MNTQELLDEIEVIAKKAVDNNHPAVASILYSLLGAIKSGQEPLLCHFVVEFAKDVLIPECRKKIQEQAN